MTITVHSYYGSDLIPSVVAPRAPAPAEVPALVTFTPSDAELADGYLTDTIRASQIAMRSLWPLYMKWGMVKRAAALVQYWEGELAEAQRRATAQPVVLDPRRGRTSREFTSS
jgi:hypothetical protein